MIKQGVLLDTSFFIRLMDESEPLHKNALGYFKYFLESDFELFISTIAIAEYCVRGKLDELPLRNLKILPFNLDHADKTGELAEVVFKEKNRLSLSQRNIIPNDTKLFAQAAIEERIMYYLSSDSESNKIYTLLREKKLINFEFIDFNHSFGERFGILEL
jgi:predicted nucleic acid-binding protein